MINVIIRVECLLPRLIKEEVNSLEDVYLLDDSKAHEILGSDFATWSRGRQMLPSTKEALEALKIDLWNDLVGSLKYVDMVKSMWYNGEYIGDGALIRLVSSVHAN